MADENMTGSEATTTETPAVETPSPAPASPDTSTTEAPAEGETLLTPPANPDTGPDPDPAPDGEEKPDEKAAFYGAPEGDYEVTGLPEGMTVDAEALAVVTPIAKELNLSNEGLGKLAGVYAEQILPKVAEQLTSNLEKDIATQHAAWASESLEMVAKDPLFEGNRKLADVQAISAKALDRFGGSEIREFLGTTGLGNHPAFVKAFYQIGTAISEDTTFERGSTAPTPKTAVEKFYGTQTQ